MAIFKRNRNQRKKTIIPAEPVPAQQAAASEEPAVEVQESTDSFKPVLAFGTENETPEMQAAVEKDPVDEVEGEIDSIAGIFGAAEEAAAPVLPSPETSVIKGKWFKHRERAIAAAKKAAKETAADGGAPIVQPMQSVDEEMKSPKPKRAPRPKPETPVSLAFADLSGRTDLDPCEIEDATDIYGIKYPAGFDTSEVDYDGRAIDFSNFSLVDGLRWKHIEGASDISGVVFPSTFDVDNAVFFGRCLRSCDFSAVYALKWKHIESAEDIVAIKYPATFDIENAEYYARNISGSDFSLISKMRFEHIANASDITGIRYPASFDVSGAEFAGRDISGSDFSLCQSLKWEHIKDAAALQGVIYPADFCFGDADFSGRDISGSDFSRAKEFPFKTIAGAINITNVKYPDCFDSAQAQYNDRNISGSNFSRVASLRWAHIKPASDITRLVYPPQFDIDEADFSGRDIDYSDFSLLPGINWDSIRLAESREGLVFPSKFVEPTPTLEEIEGAMLIFLLKLYNREYRGNLEIEKFYDDISALYPGVDDVTAAQLIDSATEKWEHPDGKKIIEQTARCAHIGDKLFMLKLGFKLLYPRHGLDITLKLLREQFGCIFKKHEKERFEKRLSDLEHGKYLSAAELSAIGFKPAAQQKTERLVELDAVVTEKPSERSAEESAEAAEQQPDEAPAAAAQEPDSAELPVTAAESEETSHSQHVPEGKVYSFGHVELDAVSLSDEPFELPEAQVQPAAEIQAPEAPVIADNTAVAESDEPIRMTVETDQFRPVATSESLQRQATAPHTVLPPAEEKAPAAAPAPVDDFIAKPVDLSKLRQQRAARKPVPAVRKDKLTDEEKAIRTGVMGMILYIHQNTSDEPLSNSELFSEFMKIYPGAAPKEAAAMAQFATNTLNGTDTATRSKLFMFASRAAATVKRKLLDFAYSEYVYRLSETADEEIFRDFLMALCSTLFDDSPEYEYSSYLRSKDILKDPPLTREASYRRIAFEHNIGKANLYANEHYPYHRTLQQVGFQNYNFEAIRANLLIEVSDNRYYEELEKLVYRDGEPGLLQFVIIDTQMGYLYLEKRCVDDWGVSPDEVWDAAEHNMESVGMKPKYSFASSECTSFRYIQHDLASYVLCMPELLDEMALGRDLIITVPCREIVYVDFYDFGAIKKMLEFTSRYNCSLIINGDEYEHPFSPDVFIYHTNEQVFERVNDETYILLGDSVSRRQVLRSVLPLNIDTEPAEMIKPKTTDEVAAINDEQYIIQEAAYTLLRLYSEVNGDTDYTLPQNAFMAVVDEVYASFDAVYPPPRGREQPDPMDHLESAAQMAMKGGKTLCWLTIQAFQYLCGDIKYETPTAAHIRTTVLNEIYGDNANAVWLNCATATDFQKRFDAMTRVHEIMVQNQHLTILESKVEVAMHVLVMMFHQFGRRYALGQVRYHLLRAIPDITFSYEINQSAWLPSPGEDIDVDAQSLGMMFRGFDRAAQERMLAAFADAIGDRDLAEGGWPLLYFIKFVKYSYLDPVEMVERYFVRRSRLIPSQTVLKQLYYKDLNNEFVKHSRTAAKAEDLRYDDAFDERSRPSEPFIRSVESFDSSMGFEDTSAFEAAVKPPVAEKPVAAFQKPDLQLRPIEEGFLEKRLSFVMEELNEQNINSLREAAHYVTKVFHVPEMMFKANDDVECELHYGIIRSREQITTLRSFAWTLFENMAAAGHDLRDVTEKDVAIAIETVEDNNRIHYKSNSHFPVLCSMPLDDGMYIPTYQEYIFFAQELLPEVRLASLFSLQNELMALAPSMKIVYDMLRAQQKGDIMPPQGALFDTLAAWSAFSFACSEPFEVVEGPTIYNYNQISR